VSDEPQDTPGTEDEPVTSAHEVTDEPAAETADPTIEEPAPIAGTPDPAPEPEAAIAPVPEVAPEPEVAIAPAAPEPPPAVPPPPPPIDSPAGGPLQLLAARPEVALGLAFIGGLVLAQILKRLGRR
jgi:dihydroneopterin aldolase/2-amino-4-hydroxy-6-hydroxymethyldihydropteridine diphosphokinase